MAISSSEIEGHRISKSINMIYNTETPYYIYKGGEGNNEVLYVKK